MNENNFQKKLIQNHISLRKSLKLSLFSFISLLKSIAYPRAFLYKIYMLIYQLNTHKIKENHKLLDSRQSLRILLEEKKSLIRIGEGDIYLALNSILIRKTELYESKNPILQRMIIDIMTDYNEESPYFLALNNVFLKMTNYELLRSGLYSLYYTQRYYYKKYLSKKNVIYLDSLMFRPESSLQNHEIETIWQNSRLVVVHNDIETFYLINNRNTNPKNFIKIEPKEIFNSYNSILKQILAVEFIDKSICLIAAGPTAKILVQELSKRKIRSYDVGSYFDWKLKNKTFY